MRLAREIYGRHLLATPSKLRLVGHDREHHGTDRNDTPRSDPQHRAAIELVLLGEKPGQRPAAGIINLMGAGPMVGFLCHALL